MSRKSSKILIVDDHPIFRMGMAELLNQEDDFEVCGLAEDILGARKILLNQTVDMSIVDITLGGDNGLDLVKEISSEKLCPAVLVLSMHDEAVWAERAIRAGAKGYIMKREASESVISALRNIRQGKLHVSASMISILLDKFHINKGEAKSTATVDLLTDRELEVFRQIGLGLSTREIAAQMNLGVKTIGTYRDRIKQKLCIKSGAELVRRAVLWTEKDSLEG